MKIMDQSLKSLSQDLYPTMFLLSESISLPKSLGRSKIKTPESNWDESDSVRLVRAKPFFYTHKQPTPDRIESLKNKNFHASNNIKPSIIKSFEIITRGLPDQPNK